MTEELDDEMKDLLDQLDEQDEFLPTEEEISEEIKPAEEPTKPKPTKENKPKEKEKLDPVINKVMTGDEVALRPIDEVEAVNDQRRFDESVISNALAAVSEPLEIGRYLEKMDEVSEEVLQACRSDRAEAQDVINMLRAQCDAAHTKNIFPARMYVDGLVKAVEVKANINTNAVKVMEGVAKMIAATKAGTNIQNNTLQVTGAELDELLSGQGPDNIELD